MTEEAAAAETRPAAKAKKLSIETVRETILAKLKAKGAAGAAIALPKDAAKASAYAQALATLETEEVVFADRRKAKPKYYLWEHQPAVPTAQSAALDLERLAGEKFPAALTETELKRLAGKEKAALIQAALVVALEEHRLFRVELRSGKTVKMLYISSAGVRSLLHLEEATPAQASYSGAAKIIRTAYDELVRRTRFRAVSILRLQDEAGLDPEEVRQQLQADYLSGHVVLSEGDWSLASEDERRAAIEIHGQRCLLVRFL